MTEPQTRWKESLTAAAAQAYEAAHGSAIHESRRGLRVRMTWRQAGAALAAIGLLATLGWWFARQDGPPAVPLTEVSGEPTSAAVALVVDVAGAVESPGLIELPAGSRVADAIDAAGGASADAILDGLNLARRVNDGEQIRVSHAGEQDGPDAGLVNLNSASAEQLEELPGVGPVIAARIVADREANGPFASLADLSRVAGVGDAVVGALDGIATV